MPRTGLWRIFICDKWGNVVSNISNIAEDRKVTETQNAPATLTFACDSSHPKIAGFHTDGAPRLDYLRRTVKAYRYEEQTDGTWQYVLRHKGWVWPLTDSGDDEADVTRVTVFDPLIVMSKRLARTAAGSWVSVPFDNVAGGEILRTIVDRTNSFAGPSGLITAGGILQTTTLAKVEWQFKKISECVAELTKDFDISVEPIDSPGNIEHGRLHVWEKRGVLRSNLLMSFDAPGHNVSQVERIMDPQDAANVLIGVGTAQEGGGALQAVGVDAANAAEYIQLEEIHTFSDVKDQTHLNNLVASELSDRLPPTQAVTVKPFKQLRPWQDFGVGDRGYVVAGPRLRGGILKHEARIHGFTVTIDDDDNEDVDIVTSPDE